MVRTRFTPVLNSAVTFPLYSKSECASYSMPLSTFPQGASKFMTDLFSSTKVIYCSLYNHM